MDLACIFWVPGATNDIIVVNQSPVFNDLFDNKAPDSSFVVNGTQYKHGYYLVDEIYLEWSTFVKAFSWPSNDKRMEFKTRQESARKDIERTFATLKDKWHVVKYPARVWSCRKLQEIMYTCIILHNMIREDKGIANYPFDETKVLPHEVETNISEEDRAINVHYVRNQERHINLRADLSEHFSNGDVWVRLSSAMLANLSETWNKVALKATIIAVVEKNRVYIPKIIRLGNRIRKSCSAKRAVRIDENINSEVQDVNSDIASDIAKIVKAILFLNIGLPDS
ncbi:hypothetical protein OSB04_014963 [Centaurea solstitialis]|uniref:Protein ALP1-like n=1 Tax=Centaurea solstitialis TaxID=347529 RepID=A0AA38SY91_9ASTR|nr:hypothetical protein OSB04_014963 [Centaurea solstitialis]